jgi:hypothetical protein
VEKAVQQWGDRDALISVHQGHRLTFRKVKEEVSNSSMMLLRFLVLLFQYDILELQTHYYENFLAVLSLACAFQGKGFQFNMHNYNSVHKSCSKFLRNKIVSRIM